MKTLAKIISIDGQEQAVKIEFTEYSVGKWFGSGRYHYIQEVTVIDDLTFIPSDLDQDLEVAIADALHVDALDVNMKDCIVTYQVTVPMTFVEVEESKEYTEMLFI
jgi:hypothetical protein